MMTTLLALPKTYTIPALTPKAMFWMHRLIYFFFVDVFHGIIMPLIMLIPMDLKASEVSEFYVRKPEIAPRRPPFEESRRIMIVGDHKASTSKNSKSKPEISSTGHQLRPAHPLELTRSNLAPSSCYIGLACRRFFSFDS